MKIFLKKFPVAPDGTESVHFCTNSGKRTLVLVPATLKVEWPIGHETWRYGPQGEVLDRKWVRDYAYPVGYQVYVYGCASDGSVDVKNGTGYKRMKVEELDIQWTPETKAIFDKMQK